MNLGGGAGPQGEVPHLSVPAALLEAMECRTMHMMPEKADGLPTKLQHAQQQRQFKAAAGEGLGTQQVQHRGISCRQDSKL